MGAQLCPDSIAASTPQAFLAASSADQVTLRRSRQPHDRRRARAAARPRSTRFRAGSSLTGVQPLVHLRYASLSRSPDPSHLVVLADPGFDGAAPTRPCVSRVRLPPASPNCCDSSEVGTYTPHGSMAPHGARPRPRSRGCGERPGGPTAPPLGARRNPGSAAAADSTRSRTGWRPDPDAASASPCGRGSQGTVRSGHSASTPAGGAAAGWSRSPPSAPKLTSMTDAPGRQSTRFNAVLTRTSSSLASR